MVLDNQERQFSQADFYTNLENFKPKDTSTILNRLLIGSYPELQSIDAKKN
jgi:hypothetical protein